MKYLFALFWIPALSYAADSTTRALTVDERFLWTHFFVAGLSLAGWAGSSLPKLAGWGEGWKARYEILQGIIVAWIAGNIAYYAGWYLLSRWDFPEVGCFMATIIAAWGGDKFLTPLLDTMTDFAKRVTGKVTP